MLRRWFFGLLLAGLGAIGLAAMPQALALEPAPRPLAAMVATEQVAAAQPLPEAVAAAAGRAVATPTVQVSIRMVLFMPVIEVKLNRAAVDAARNGTLPPIPDPAAQLAVSIARGVLAARSGRGVPRFPNRCTRSCPCGWIPSTSVGRLEKRRTERDAAWPRCAILL